MLILKRGPNQRIVIETSDGPISIMVTKLCVADDGQILSVKLGIDAPKKCRVLREELTQDIRGDQS